MQNMVLGSTTEATPLTESVVVTSSGISQGNPISGPDHCRYAANSCYQSEKAVVMHMQAGIPTHTPTSRTAAAILILRLMRKIWIFGTWMQEGVSE
jgi:hypothetical protein